MSWELFGKKILFKRNLLGTSLDNLNECNFFGVPGILVVEV